MGKFATTCCKVGKKGGNSRSRLNRKSTLLIYDPIPLNQTSNPFNSKIPSPDPSKMVRTA
jgi:hypothetical protein